MSRLYKRSKDNYIDLKNKYGGGDDNDEDDDETNDMMRPTCTAWPTREEVCQQMDQIIGELSTDCLKYAFIPEELDKKLKTLLSSDPDFFSDSNESVQEEYHTYLKDTFFPNENATFITQMRHIKYLANSKMTSASSIWHQDTDTFQETFYNVLYYMKIENMEYNCGTDIAYKDGTGKIVIKKLPVLEGLIIIMRDDCIGHKSPVLRLLNDREDGHRMIMRTYIRTPDRFRKEFLAIDGKNRKIAAMNKELNAKKIERCLKKIFDEKISEADRIDCENVVRHADTDSLNGFFKNNNIHSEEQKRYHDKIVDLQKRFIETLL